MPKPRTGITVVVKPPDMRVRKQMSTRAVHALVLGAITLSFYLVLEAGSVTDPETYSVSQTDWSASPSKTYPPVSAFPALGL